MNSKNTELDSMTDKDLLKKRPEAIAKELRQKEQNTSRDTRRHFEKKREEESLLKELKDTFDEVDE